mgnify:CR=1 FL=1|tara:strand:+ start:24243 stop:25208 length:966 start_codon:yes stop_codon:yes gene_type:complete
MTKPGVLITSRPPNDVIQRLEEFSSVIVGDNPSRAMSRAEVLAQIGNVAGIINQNELRIDPEILEAAPKLKIVANTAAGFDNMDIAEMRRRRIWGCNCPDSYSVDTATHTIALLLALTRRLTEADRYVRSGKWADDGWMPGGRWDGVSLSGKRLGLVGFGHIGRQVARRAEAFDMIVSHHTRTDTGAKGWTSFDELVRGSDVISLHCPLTPETRHLFDARVFAAMKPGAILLNVARGPVVRNEDLVAALKSGRLAGAGLDVFEFEPEVPGPLLDMTNVILSPHMGGCTVEARKSAWSVCVDNVLRVLQGGSPATSAFSLDA